MRTAACFSILIHGRTVPPFSLPSCADSFCHKVRASFARKHCWARIQIEDRVLNKHESGERTRLACNASPARTDRALAIANLVVIPNGVRDLTIGAWITQLMRVHTAAYGRFLAFARNDRIPLNAREARPLPNPTLSNPTNPSPPFPQPSRSRRQ